MYLLRKFLPMGTSTSFGKRESNKRSNAVLGLVLSLFCLVSAQTGTVDSDIQFTTHTGESHSLFALLESGKYVCVGGYAYGG